MPESPGEYVKRVMGTEQPVAFPDGSRVAFTEDFVQVAARGCSAADRDLMRANRGTVVETVSRGQCAGFVRVRWDMPGGFVGLEQPPDIYAVEN